MREFISEGGELFSAFGLGATVYAFMDDRGLCGDYGGGGVTGESTGWVAHSSFIQPSTHPHRTAVAHVVN